jgi:hypothetical protein
MDAAIVVRDAALTAFLEGVDPALVAARVALAACVAEKESAAAELASLERTINERKKRIDAALSGARTNATQAVASVEIAQNEVTIAKTNHASAHGRLIELQKQRDAEDLAAAETRLQEAIARHAALPVPDRLVTDDEISAARNSMASVKSDIADIEGNIHRAQGALQQVGGAVARERLRDVTEAFELAERHEREIEARVVAQFEI